MKNIFSSDEIAKTDSLKDLKTFHEQFVRLIKIAVFLRNAFNSCEEFDECFNDDLFDFCKTPCADCSDFAELKDIISDVKIKKEQTWMKNFKMYAANLCVYLSEINGFPSG